MNLALEKGERVTTGGKSTGEIGGKAGEVTGVVANAPTTDGLAKRYRWIEKWRKWKCNLRYLWKFTQYYVIKFVNTISSH